MSAETEIIQPMASAWDSILAESSRQLENTPRSESSPTRMILALRPTAEAKHLTRIPRNAALIPAILRDQIRRLVRSEVDWPLFVYGPPGTGKTCAALCLLDHAGGSYYTASGLAKMVIQAQQGRLAWNHEGRGGVLWEEQFWRLLVREPLVVLDELGCRERVSDHHYECIKRLLDERHGRPLVVISNSDLDELARLYDDRITSRLVVGTVVRLEGDDRRLKK